MNITDQLAAVLRFALARIELANKEGVSILSAHVTEMREALAAYDAFRVTTDPDTGHRTFHAALMNEKGIARVSGSEAAVKRCIELGRFERTPVPKVDPAQRDYLKSKGGNCPSCGSGNIEGQEVDIDAGSASQEVSCNDCDAQWFDTYVLTGFINLERP